MLNLSFVYDGLPNLINSVSLTLDIDSNSTFGFVMMRVVGDVMEVVRPTERGIMFDYYWHFRSFCL